MGGHAVAIGHVGLDELIDLATIGDEVQLHRSIPGGAFVYETTLAVTGFDAVFANIDHDVDEDLLASGSTLEPLDASGPVQLF